MEDIRNNPVITGNIKAGSLANITPGSGRVALGSRLAQALGAYPGSEISLISPDGRSTVVGTVPRIVTFTVDGRPAPKVQQMLSDCGVNVSVSLVDYARLDLPNRGPGDIVRASVHYYNTEDELQQLIKALPPLN